MWRIITSITSSLCSPPPSLLPSQVVEPHIGAQGIHRRSCYTQVMIIESAKVPPTTQLWWSRYKITPAHTEPDNHSHQCSGNSILVQSQTFQTLRKKKHDGGEWWWWEQWWKWKKGGLGVRPGPPVMIILMGSALSLTRWTFSQKSLEVQIAAEIEFRSSIEGWKSDRFKDSI